MSAAGLPTSEPLSSFRLSLSSMEKVVIIGTGCAGLTAALYTARANLKPLVLTGTMPGGLLTTTSIVENFPGFPEGIDGYELMTRMQKQAERFGARVQFGTVESVDFSRRPIQLMIDGERIKRVEVTTSFGGQSEVIYITESGRRITRRAE